MRSFSISYPQAPMLAGLFARNRIALIGRGTVEVTRGEVRLVGYRARLLLWGRVPHEISIQSATIRNVTATDRVVAFEFKTTDGRTQRATVWADNSAQARVLASELPQVSTPEFQQSMVEHSEFYPRLLQRRPHAYVTSALIAINVLVFALTVWDGAGLLQPDGRVLIHWGSNFGPLTEGGQPWRLLTSMFLHFGALHLVLNLWALSSLGALVERLYGSGHFLLLYLLAGITGSAASLAWNPIVNSAGASGAVFGVLAALPAFALDKQAGVPLGIMRHHRSTALFFIGLNLVNGYINPGIDNAAHIGGLIGGFGYGLLLARPLQSQGSRSIVRTVIAILVCATAVWFSL
ncbi:MAG TPA: rhomboid family intramembrane serine protease [Steroidobacteraceae bacterium]|nr:rhomboid family intramembrane serine protease [Steroidobacteraceae bacterium]